MLNPECKNVAQGSDHLTRRDFLRAGALSAGAAGLTLGGQPSAGAAVSSRDINCILLFLVGGPSQLETWDPKPGAPAAIRGPFRPIQTSVPGIQISDHFPRMARMAERYSIVRSVHHEAAPIHETGQQLMQTGHLFESSLEYPHYGAVLSHVKGSRPEGIHPFLVLPGPIGNTGVSVSHGQTAGFLGVRHEPFVVPCDPVRLQEPKANEAFALGKEKDGQRSQYGWNTFGQSCLLARRLGERGARLVTVNMFDTVYDRITWDCHADGGALGTRLEDYKTTLCPMFDQAYTALLDDLAQRGQLDTTLVVAMGEFGRTPRLNSRGGRDHWPGVWSILFAGGGVKGGQIIGSSDKHGAEPRDRPVTPAEVAATIYKALGIDPKTRLPGPDGRPLQLSEGRPIMELFRA